MRLRLETLSRAGVFTERPMAIPAAGSCGWLAQRQLQGTLQPGAEVAEALWVTHAERHRCAPAARLVVDTLHRRGELD